MRSQSRGHLFLRDSELVGVVVGRATKKQDIVDSMVTRVEIGLEEAMVHRDNFLFQQAGIRDRMLAVIQGVEVWRDRVEELLAWTPEKGELVDEGGEAGAVEGAQVEEQVEEQPTKRRKESTNEGGGVVREGGVGGGGGGEGGAYVAAVGWGRAVRKDLGGGLWGVREARSALIPRSQRKPPASRSRSHGEGGRGEGSKVEVEKERENMDRSAQGGRGRRPHVKCEGAGPDVGESFWTGGSGEKHQLGVEGEHVGGSGVRREGRGPEGGEALRERAGGVDDRPPGFRHGRVGGEGIPPGKRLEGETTVGGVRVFVRIRRVATPKAGGHGVRRDTSAPVKREPGVAVKREPGVVEGVRVMRDPPPPVKREAVVEEEEGSDDDMIIEGGESGGGMTWDKDAGQWVPDGSS